VTPTTDCGLSAVTLRPARRCRLHLEEHNKQEQDCYAGRRSCPRPEPVPSFIALTSIVAGTVLGLVLAGNIVRDSSK